MMYDSLDDEMLAAALRAAYPPFDAATRRRLRERLETVTVMKPVIPSVPDPGHPG